MRALKVRSVVANHQKLIMTNRKQSLKVIVLQLCEKSLKISMLAIFMVTQHLKHTGKKKKLDK